MKKYVVPYNPKTEDQKTQRGYLEEANLVWKNGGYTEADKEAWNLYAKTIRGSKSGYNCFMGFKINASKNNKTWENIYDYVFLEAHADWVMLMIKSNSDKNAKLYLGTSKENMIKEYSGYYETVGPDTWLFSPDELNEKTKYYFYVKNTAANEEARTGIYSFITIETPAGYFIDEDIPGGEVTNIVPLNRTDGLGIGNTIKIGVGLPTEENQDIKSIQEGVSVTIWGAIYYNHYIGEEVIKVI